MKKEIVFTALITLGLVIMGVFGLQKLTTHKAGNNGAEVWSPSQQLDYANTLSSKGLSRQAAAELQQYVDRAVLSKKESAGIYYKLGNMYLGLGEYEKALASYYKAEMLAPNPDYASEMNQNIVSALEHLGLSQQSQYELESRTSVSASANKGAGELVARIGKRQIWLKDIEGAIQRLPPQTQDELKDDQIKLKFIRQYVASEVLYDKAKKLGFDRSPFINEAVESYKRDISVQSLVQKEVEQGLKVTTEDLTLYYRANRERYLIPERIKVSYLEAGIKAKAEDIALGLKAGKGKKVEQWIAKDNAFIPELGELKEIAPELFKPQKGEASQILKLKDKSYMFLIEDKQPQRQLSFEETRSQVEAEYRLKKQQDIVNNLLNKTLEQQEVEILFKPENQNADAKK